jgi:hypothetical protein
MVKGFELLCMKFCYLCLKSRLFSTSINDAPTEDQEEEDKEEFYENLETAYDNQ